MQEGNEVKKLIQIIIIVVIILFVFYGLTVIITNHKKDIKRIDEDTINTVIEYDKILVSDIYNQQEDSYYILATLENDKNLKTYNSKINNYREKENSIKIYTLNLNSAFNKKYIKETSDFSLEYPNFKDSTLLKIENHEIIASYEGSKEILTELETMINE